MSDTTYDRGALKPYLELPHLLSLTWLAYPILSLLFVAFRLQLSLASADDAISRAKDSLVNSCKAAEGAATGAASLPRYLALAANEQYAEAVNAAMEGARQALVLSLTVMEGIINFIVDLYRSTFLCFLELVIRGGLAIIIAAVNEINSAVQSVSSGLKSTLQTSITDINNTLQSAIDGINKINPFSDIKAPQIAMPDLSSLDNVTLSSSLSNTLTNLNSSLPTFQELKDKLEDFIDTPFELVKKDINDTFAGKRFSGNTFAVPDQNTLSFCNDVDTSVVDDIGAALVKTAKIGIVILIVLALLLIAANCALEWYKWRCMKRHLEYTRQAWLTDPILYAKEVHVASAPPPTMTLTDHNLLMLQSNSSNPLITRYVNIFSRKLGLSQSKHVGLQWFLSYIFHAPALACLLIGVFGLLSVQIQLIALGPIEDQFKGRVSETVSNFNTLIASNVNTNMQNQSAWYAQQVNTRVAVTQQEINDGLFGWVDNTTSSLNTTLNEFYSDVQNAVTTVFGGTFMEAPAQEFIKCLIGSKVEALENALTFLHDNLEIQIPHLNNSVLVLSDSSVNEITGPVAAAAVGGDNGDENSSLVGRIVASYAAGLRKERIMFAIFIGLWGVVVLMGIAILVWHSYIRPSMEKRKRRKYEESKQAGVNAFVSPFRGGLGSMSSSNRLDDLSPPLSPKVEEANLAIRNSSPPRSVVSHQKSWESFQPTDVAKHSTFGFSISKPKKLMAIGRKAMGRERFVSDEEAREKERQEQERNEIAPWMSHEDRSSTWYGRIAAVLPKPRHDPELADPIPALPNNRSRPNLTIDTELAAPTEQTSIESRSRWSSSPKPQKPQKPWMSRFSNSIAPGPQPTASSQPPLPSYAHPQVGVPIRSNQLDLDVPRDVTTASFQDSVLGGPSPAPEPVLAPPLHHGFHRPAYNGLPPNPRSPPPSQRALSPPPSVGAHRRSVSAVPASKFKSMQFHQSSKSTELAYNVNPFATPFDGEHSVKIMPPSQAAVRKSIPTNPFSPPATSNPFSPVTAY